MRNDVAVVFVQIDGFNDLLDEPGQVFYDIYRMYLQSQELILELAELVAGTFVAIGNGRFYIGTTEHLVELHLTDHHKLLSDVEKQTAFHAKMGIGYGQTSREAERNARMALGHARKSMDSSCFFLIRASGVVTGPFGSSNHVSSFQYRTENAKLILKLERAGVSVATYSRLLHVQEHTLSQTLDAAFVADRLHMTPRNARKILSSLEDAGLALVTGKSTPLGKGRPRLIYRVLDEGGITTSDE